MLPEVRIVQPILPSVQVLALELCVGEGKRMEWDAPNMCSPNLPEAVQFVRRTYREGWKS